MSLASDIILLISRKLFGLEVEKSTSDAREGSRAPFARKDAFAGFTQLRTLARLCIVR